MLVAVVPGRAFIQTPDGERLDLQAGEAIPGCGLIKNIDADKGEVSAERCTVK